MRFAKQVSGSAVRFCRVKRKGTRNCRVVWLDNNEEQLLSLASIEECPAEEAVPAVAVADTTNQLPPSVLTELSGDDFCRLMRNYQVSVKELAARLGVGTDRVREARSGGLHDAEQIAAWTAAVQAQPTTV